MIIFSKFIRIGEFQWLGKSVFFKKFHMSNRPMGGTGIIMRDCIMTGTKRARIIISPSFNFWFIFCPGKFFVRSYLKRDSESI
jgi:hypothetical protein